MDGQCTRYTVERQSGKGAVLRDYSTGRYAVTASTPDVSYTRDIRYVSSTTTWVTSFQLIPAVNCSGLVTVTVAGQNIGGTNASFAQEQEFWLSRSSDGSTISVSAITPAKTFGEIVDLDISLTQLAGYACVVLKLPTGSTSTSVRGTVSIRYRGPLERIDVLV